jgi:hypothetical protein
MHLQRVRGACLIALVVLQHVAGVYAALASFQSYHIPPLPHGINPHGSYAASHSASGAQHSMHGTRAARRMHVMSSGDGSAPVTSLDATAGFHDYVIERATRDEVRVGTQVTRNTSITITFYLDGTAAGKVARLQLADEYNHTGILLVRARSTVRAWSLNLRQWVPEVTKLYESKVSETDAVSGDATPTLAANATARTNLTQTAPLVARRLLEATSTTTTTSSSVATSRRLLAIAKAPAAPWTRIVTVEEYAYYAQNFDLLYGGLFTQIRNSGLFPQLTEAKRMCAYMQRQYTLDTLGAYPGVTADNIFAKIGELYTKAAADGPWSGQEVSLQFGTGTCVMDVDGVDAAGKPAPAQSMSQECVPDLDRPVNFYPYTTDDAANPQPDLRGAPQHYYMPHDVLSTDGNLYETLAGTPQCPCAPVTNSGFRSCTLNVLHPAIRTNGAAVGIVQKCMSTALTSAYYNDADRAAAAPKDIRRVSYCVPVMMRAYNQRLLGKLETKEFSSCADGEAGALKGDVRKAVNGIIVGPVIGALTGWNWPFPKQCPKYAVTVRDDTSQVNALVAGATTLAASVSRLNAIAADTVTAAQKASAAVLSADATVAILANLTAVNSAMVGTIQATETGLLGNQQAMQASALETLARASNLSDVAAANVAPLTAQLGDARARLNALTGTSANFTRMFNASLEALQTQLTRIRPQVAHLARMERVGADSLESLASIVQRFEVGRETYDAVERSARLSLARAVNQGWRPLVSDRTAPDTYGYAPEAPGADASDVLVDRAWVYWVTSARPQRYTDGNTTADASVAWVTQQTYEVHCALPALMTSSFTNVTIDRFQGMVGGGVVNCTFGVNGTVASTCACVVRVVERICPRAVSPTVALADLQNRALGFAYMAPLSQGNVTLACADRVQTLPEVSLERTDVLAAHVRDTCIGRNGTDAFENSVGAFVYASQTRGGSLLHVPSWTRVRAAVRSNATQVAAGTAIDVSVVAATTGARVDTSPSGALEYGAGDVWDTAFLYDAARTPADWCTTVASQMSTQARATGAARLQTLPQVVYGQWTLAVQRVLGSAYMREMAYRVSGRAPRFGLHLAYAAYDAQPLPSDLTPAALESETATYRAYQFGANGTNQVAYPTDPVAFKEFVLAARLERQRMRRPYHVYRTTFVANGASMMPVHFPTGGALARTTTVEFASDATLNATGFGAYANRVSPGDLAFLNAQLKARSYTAASSESYADADIDDASEKALRALVGYLSCALDHEGCALPQGASAASNDTAGGDTGRGFYFYQASAALLPDDGRYTKQRASAINAIRARVAVDPTTPTPTTEFAALSAAEYGFNSTQRRPMISATQYLMEEVLEPADAPLFRAYMASLLPAWRAYVLTHFDGSDAAAARNGSSIYDLVDLDDASLVGTLTRLQLSPQHQYEPRLAATNPDRARAPLVDATDTAYTRDANAFGVDGLTTPLGRPNFVRRLCANGAGDTSDVCAWLARHVIVRDPRALGLPLPEGHDPDRADTWRTLFAVPAREQVTIKIDVGAEVLQQLLAMRATCTRNLQVTDPLTDAPTIVFTRPSPERALRVRLNVTTASGACACDGARTVLLAAGVTPLQLQNDYVSVALPPGCVDLRRVDVVDVYDVAAAATLATQCAGWTLTGAVTRPSLTADAVDVIESRLELSDTLAAQLMLARLDASTQAEQAFLEQLLSEQLSVLDYAARESISIPAALAAVRTGTAGAEFTYTDAAGVQVVSTRVRDDWTTVLATAGDAFATDPDAAQSILDNAQALADAEVALRLSLGANNTDTFVELAASLGDVYNATEFLQPLVPGYVVYKARASFANSTLFALNYTWLYEVYRARLFADYTADGWGCLSTFADLAAQFPDMVELYAARAAYQVAELEGLTRDRVCLPQWYAVFSIGNCVRHLPAGDLRAVVVNLAVWLGVLGAAMLIALAVAVTLSNRAWNASDTFEPAPTKSSSASAALLSSTKTNESTPLRNAS